MSTEIYETYGAAGVFCEALGRIERIGSCRRLNPINRPIQRNGPSEADAEASLGSMCPGL